MKVVSATEAIRAIPNDARVVLPHGCVEPTALYRAFQQEHQRFSGLQLYSGLQFGDYPFLRAGLGTHFSYTTWQASARLRSYMQERRIDVLPLRFRDVTRVVSRSGPIVPDVVVVQTTRPRRNEVSLGISVSLYLDLIRDAPLVIAELNEHMPWTHGASRLPLGAIHLGVESSEPLGTYRSPRRSARDDKIVESVLRLIPAGAWVQFGVGAIPDAVLCRLHEVRDVNIHSGMLTEGLMDFVRRSRHRARVVTGEVAGSPALYDFVGRSQQIELQPVTVTHNLLELAKLCRFVSINSAVEVDLQGQVNGETIDGLQISGVGGSLDFMEGAEYSPGGMSILALASTTEDGSRSKLVRRLGARTPVTIPRFCADYVVTEFGAARIRGLSVRERAAALTAIAHPDWRSELARP
jgi:4-hydroxybutyrate CoA-transferase